MQGFGDDRFLQFVSGSGLRKGLGQRTGGAGGLAGSLRKLGKLLFALGEITCFQLRSGGISRNGFFGRNGRDCHAELRRSRIGSFRSEHLAGEDLGAGKFGFDGLAVADVVHLTADRR